MKTSGAWRSSRARPRWRCRGHAAPARGPARRAPAPAVQRRCPVVVLQAAAAWVAALAGPWPAGAAHPLGARKAGAGTRRDLQRSPAGRWLITWAEPSSCTSLPSPLATRARPWPPSTAAIGATAGCAPRRPRCGRCPGSGAAARPSRRSRSRPPGRSARRRSAHRVVGLGSPSGGAGRCGRPRRVLDQPPGAQRPAAPSAAAAGRSTARRAAADARAAAARRRRRAGSVPIGRSGTSGRSGRCSGDRHQPPAQRASSVDRAGPAAARHSGRRPSAAGRRTRAPRRAAGGAWSRGGPRPAPRHGRWRWRAGQAGARSSGRSGQSSPIAATSAQSMPSSPADLRRGQLVVHAEARAPARGRPAGGAPRRVAPGDDHGLDAALRQQLQAMAVERVEGLEGLAVLADVQPPVGEHAVDVEDRQRMPRPPPCAAAAASGGKAAHGCHLR
jgi:hypothetical protein